MYIYNEILQWDIDWVNTQFTTTLEIDKVEEVYLGWAAYRNISFSWNVITFNDAPPLWVNSPTVDYFSVDTGVENWTGDYTFWTLIDDIYGEIGQDRDSWTYLIDIVKRKINQNLKKTRNDKYYNNSTRSYSFNKAEDVPAIWYNASSIEVWDIDYVPANWYILINWNLVKYTDYMDWQLNWAAWYVYSSGDKVQIGYNIPEWVKNISEVKLNSEKLEYSDFRNELYNHYTIVTDSTWERYLFLPYYDEAVITVKYQPTNWILVNDDDVVNFEYEYMDVIIQYVVYSMLMSREDDRWIDFKREYLDEYKKYKSYKNRVTSSTNRRIRSNALMWL